MADIERPVGKPSRKKKRESKGRMANFLMFLPNMVVLLGRLLRDARVPTAEKALFVAAIVYVISPIDLIPDIFPFIGQVDDIYMVALSLLRLVNRTDEDVVRKHWQGGGDIVSLADSIARIAPILLPRRISRVISSKVEMSSSGKALGNIGRDNEPLLVEVPQQSIENDAAVQSAPPMSN